MNSLFRKFALPGMILAWVFSPPNAHAACATSTASLHGWYAMLVNGTTLGANVGPKLLAGALLFDGVSTVSGNNVYASQGVDSTVAGTYALNTDCTLTITMTIGSTPAQVYSVAIKTSNEAVGIEIDTSAVATIDLQAQYATYTTGLNFTSTSANGLFTGACYGASAYGAATNGPASVQSDLNIVTFSNGSLSGTDPSQGNGTVMAVANHYYSGTYTVNTDGTLSGTVTVDGDSYNFYGVIASGGAELEYFFTNGTPGPALESCVLKL
jgi:hypothetical protein